MSSSNKRNNARAKKPNNHKVKKVPKWLDKFEQFDDIERLFQKLIHGQIEFDVKSDRPVMLSNKGHYFDVCSALDGWCIYWNSLAVKHGYDYDDHALVKLNNKLSNKIDLSFKDIQQAIETIDRQKKMFDLTPRHEVSYMARTVETRLLIERTINE